MSPHGSGSPEGEAGRGPLYRLRLFVAGDEPNSARARAVLARLCEDRLRDRCEVQVVDVFEDYQAALDHKVVVVPTLVVESPPPVRTVIGSLNEEDKVLAALGLDTKGDPS